jgi:hypothetical protein
MKLQKEALNTPIESPQAKKIVALLQAAKSNASAAGEAP